MQLEQMTWEQQIKHPPFEKGPMQDMLLSVIGGLVKRIEALETKPHTITEAISEKLHKHKKHEEATG